MRRIFQDFEDFKRCSKSGMTVDRGEVVNLKWERPPPGKLKLNIDGSFREHEDVMGSGGVLRDEHGAWMCGFASHVCGGNAFLAETIALRDGLRLAWSKGIRDLICESDCKELLAAIEDTDTARFVLEVQQIVELLQRNWSVSLRYIPRHCNGVADYLAKYFSRPTPLTMMEEPWPDLQTLLLYDLVGGL